MKTVKMKVSDLNEDKRNANKHSKKNIEAIKSNLLAYEQYSPLVIRKGSNIVMIGNGRLQAMKELGWKECYCFVMDITDAEAKRLAIADNRTSELSEWDDNVLAELLQEIGIEEANGAGFDESDLASLFAQISGPPEIEETPVPDVPKKAKSKPGKVYKLGNHRLMCGDSTDKECVEKLMDGDKADMVFTDPPYGVSYADKNEFLNSLGKPMACPKRIENDDKTPDQMYDFWVSAFTRMHESLNDVCVYFVTAPQGGDLLLLLQALRDSGFMLKHQLVWVKNNHVLGRCDYNYKHEPIIYGWKIGNSHKFYGGGKFKTSTWEFNKPHQSKLHPTMKPVELVANAILDGAEQGMSVLDLFGGSGTTLIACEQTGRKCYMMELDPKYCDVIINRWCDLTGNDPKEIFKQ